MEPGSEDLHLLVLSQGGIYLNRAARIAQQSRPYFTNGLSPTLPRGHISQTTEHIHWKTELIISSPRSSRCDRNIYWSMIVEKPDCITFSFFFGGLTFHESWGCIETK